MFMTINIVAVYAAMAVSCFTLGDYYGPTIGAALAGIGWALMSTIFLAGKLVADTIYEKK